MRETLINHAVAKNRLKRGGLDRVRLTLEFYEDRRIDVTALDEALRELEALDPSAGANCGVAFFCRPNDTGDRGHARDCPGDGETGLGGGEDLAAAGVVGDIEQEMISKGTVHTPEEIDSARWERLKSILGDALELSSGGERTALLETRCADDAALRAGSGGARAGSGGRGAEATDSFRRLRGARHARALAGGEARVAAGGWGAYEVVRELGRGGMGAVYLAARADGQYEKQVAIKVLKRGTDTDEVLRRFAAEKHILARLEHANIAHLLDAGVTDDGLPYFVMEYVDGLPVTRFVREQNLSIEERLGIFLKICAAVEVAHHHHVIHRDLKPGNILVNAEGEPKLLDFGIAKLLRPGANETELTAPSEQRLTPICASPEQTDGRAVTETSDVYALGALLYELLSGRQPHTFASGHPSPRGGRAGGARGGTGTAERACRRAADRAPVARRPGCDRAPCVAEGTGGALRAGDAPRGGRAAVSGGRTGVGAPIPLADRARSIFPRRQVRWVAGAAALVMIGGALWALWPRPQAAPETAASASDPRKSIAVLPFETVGEDNPPSYFADGVQDNILTDLGRVRDLKVISRSGVAVYRGRTRSIKQIGRELGVANVLEGSVQVSGDRVRINAQLIDTHTDTQIWAEQYDRKVEDIFALQSELAQTIAAQLKATLSSGEQEELWKKPDPGSGGLRSLFARAGGDERSAATRPEELGDGGFAFLTTATERDPNFTLAYCLLNEAHVYLYRFGEEHTPENLAAAKEAAETALRLEPEREEARLALARYYYHGLSDYRRTEEELSRIPATTPHEVEFFTLASLVERRLGKWEEAIRDGEKAVELDPQDAALAVNLVQTYSGLRRFKESERVAETATRRLGEAATARLWIVKGEAALGAGDLERAAATIESIRRKENLEYQSMRVWIALLRRDSASRCRAGGRSRRGIEEGAELLAHGSNERARAAGRGEAREAFAEIERLAEASSARRPDEPEALADLAVAKAGLGESEEAVRHARRAVAIRPISADALFGPNLQLRLAEVLMMTGDREGALNLLGELVQVPFGPNRGDLQFSPVWDDIRTDARFEELLAQVARPLPIAR